MELIHYVLLAFFAYCLLRAFFSTDDTPIPETSGAVHKIANAAELRALLTSTTWVVVDFYADWCPPCRSIAPVFSRLADAHALRGRLAFAKVNVDHVKDVDDKFRVSAMPTFLFFQDGEPHGVDVPGLGVRRSVALTDGGLVDRLRGADNVALEAVVKTLASEVGTAEGSK